MKIKMVASWCSIILWILYVLWGFCGSEYYRLGMISHWNPELDEEPETYYELVERKTGMPAHVQIFYIGLFAGGFQCLAMRERKK